MGKGVECCLLYRAWLCLPHKIKLGSVKISASCTNWIQWVKSKREVKVQGGRARDWEEALDVDMVKTHCKHV